ncbi:MAG: AMP-binding protein [Candidatus Dormibacteria bacterium]
MSAQTLTGLRPGDLVACALPPGDGWVSLIDQVWQAGAALLPVDSRLPEPEARELIGRARPTMLLTSDGSARLEGETVSDGVAVVVATSGSTGSPRLVELSRDAIAAAVTSSAAVLGATGDDPWLCCIPVAHIGGLLVLLRHAVMGAPVIVHSGFSIDGVRDADVRFTSLVPTQLRRLLDAGVDCTRFSALLIGGAAMPDGLRDEARRRGANAVSTYGLTESCGGVVYNGVPLPGTSVRIADGEEIQLGGPTLMNRYRFDDAAGAAAFAPDGWLRTRDGGSLNDGVLTVSGRLDDVIVTGGEKVWPREVEEVLATHPQVAEVAVHGLPDDEWGQRVVAVVVPSDRASPPALDSVRAHVARTLPRYKAPRELVIVESLPRTSLGKVRAPRVRGGR